MSHRAALFTLLASTLTLTACGSSQPAPEPVLLSQFNANTDRFGVVSTVGRADGTTINDGRPCDIYKLFTTGLTAGGRAAVKFGEVLLGVGTLGLSTIPQSVIEAGTHPQQHTVLFCYGPDNKLVDLYDTDPTSTHHQRHTVLNKEFFEHPTALATPAAVVAGGTTLLPQTATPYSPVSNGVVSDAPIIAAPGAEVIHERAVAPLPPAESGTISLDTVSREATDGRKTISTGKTAISAEASSDDLNDISATKAATANAVLKTGQTRS